MYLKKKFSTERERERERDFIINCSDFQHLQYLLGPIATFLMNHMSHRKVALLGAVLSSAGLIAMPFAPDLVYMYGVYGVLSGKMQELHCSLIL
jgi:hypothetical protein